MCSTFHIANTEWCLPFREAKNRPQLRLSKFNYDNNSVSEFLLINREYFSLHIVIIQSSEDSKSKTINIVFFSVKQQIHLSVVN